MYTRMTLIPEQCDCTHLSVTVKDVAKEAISVGEALGPGTLTHAHHAVLFWVQHTTLEGVLGLK